MLDRSERSRDRRRRGFSIGALTTAAALIAAGVVWVAGGEDRAVAPGLLSALEATAAEDRFAFSQVVEATGSGPPQSAEGQYDVRRGMGWVREAVIPIPGAPPILQPAPASAEPDAMFDRDRVIVRVALLSSLPGAAESSTGWIAFTPPGDDNALGMVTAFAGRQTIPSLASQLTSRDGPLLFQLPTEDDATLVAEGNDFVRGEPTTRFRLQTELVTRYTVWIDAENRIRRARSETPTTPPDQPEATTTFTQVVELYDFGQPLRFEFPAAAEVKEASTLDLPLPSSSPPEVEDQGSEGAQSATDPPHPREDRASAVPASGDPSFFSLRPVIRRLDAPCVPGGPADSQILPVLPRVGDGCYEVRPPELDASAVASAQAARSDDSDEWVVDVALTPDGATRFDALAQKVGVGRPLAIVIDDVVWAAPILETTSFAGRVQITAKLDQGSALELADRLNAH